MSHSNWVATVMVLLCAFGAACSVLVMLQKKRRGQEWASYFFELGVFLLCGTVVAMTLFH